MLQERVKEAVGVFKNLDDLNEAVNELEITAFPRHDISVLGGTHGLNREYGRASIDPRLAEDDPYAPRTVPIHPEEKAIGKGVVIGVGAYIGAIAGAFILGPQADYLLFIPTVATGTFIGGALGWLVTEMLRFRFSREIEDQIDEGGLVLWVRTMGRSKERLAQDIMRKHGGTHIHTHRV